MDLVTSSGGEFTVWVDGTQVAKKTLMGGFPKEDEILKLVKSALG